MARVDIAAVNALDRAGFLQLLGEVFEHSPWVAERACSQRPFASLCDLHAAMMDAIRSAGTESQLALLRAHPDLAGSEAVAGRLTRDSTSEQGRLGFDALQPEELERMSRSNRDYHDKFGFPFITALGRHATRASVFAEQERRLANDRDAEIVNGLEQVAEITRGRLERLLHA